MLCGMEVNCSSWFYWGGWQGGSERSPTGSTLLKRRQLGQLGYTAVAVPYWEWNDLEGISEDPIQARRAHSLQ